MTSDQTRVELVKIFKLTFPPLAGGYLRQRGYVFGFGCGILHKASINNMAAE
jgi:uroporphyrinogen-III decarboxylase